MNTNTIMQVHTVSSDNQETFTRELLDKVSFLQSEELFLEVQFSTALCGQYSVTYSALILARMAE